MTGSNIHIETLIKLRAELIRQRRACASAARAAELPDLMAQIEAVDRSTSTRDSLRPFADTRPNRVVSQ